MKIKKEGKSVKKINVAFISCFALIFSLLFISIGFSSLSTTLSINGTAAFVPVGMIRVMSMTQDTLVSTSEISHSITNDSIKATIDLNSSSSTATYTVTIRNLGQIDYELDSIVEDLYSNNQVEYELNGLNIGDIIEAGDEVEFTITFKYKQDATAPLEPRLNSNLRFVFEEYEEYDPFPVVYSHDGVCQFNGSSNITGTDCQEYSNVNHIDTGIALYNQENWQKDYEIGFTIVEYNHNQQVSQAVFANTKYENESLKWPGLVARRSSTNNSMEITQSINMGKKGSATVNISQLPLDFKIYRINGVVLYSLNSGELRLLQDMSDFNQQFNLTTWFGAAPDLSGTPFRNLSGKLSNMYVKLGDYDEGTFTVTFNPNGGTVSEPTRTVNGYTKVGSLPTPIATGTKQFDGWYTNTSYTTKVTANTIVTADTTYYAKWIDQRLVEMDGNYYTTLAEAIADVPNTGVEKTIVLMDDVQDELHIPAGKNIVFDFGGHTLSNSKSSFVIENRGTLKIVSGTFINNATFSVINNESTGTLVITGGSIQGKSTKQGIYNNGGTVTISGTASISTTSSIRPTVHNISGGTLTVTGGTITSTGQNAIGNEASTLTIGVQDGTIDITDPVITGKTYGVLSNTGFTVYDGILKGRTAGVNDESNITNIGTDYVINNGTETISGATYNTLYVESNP